MRRAFAIFPLVLIFLTNAAGQAVANRMNLRGSAKDEKRIRKVLTDFTEAWNKHDAKAFSMVFAEDADFTNVAGKSAHGRAEVEKFHTPRFATNFKETHQKITEIKIRFVKPDVGAVDARWEMTGAKNREGQDIPLRKGLLNFVMTKEGAQWFISVMHNMDLPAPQ